MDIFSLNAYFCKTHRKRDFSWNLSKPEWLQFLTFQPGLRKNASVSDLLSSPVHISCLVSRVLPDKVVTNGWRLLASSGLSLTLDSSRRKGWRRPGCWWTGFQSGLSTGRWMQAVQVFMFQHAIHAWTNRVVASPSRSVGFLTWGSQSHPHARSFSCPSGSHPIHQLPSEEKHPPYYNPRSASTL